MPIDIPYIIIAILCFVPAIVFHEVMHGFAAHKLGDPTAKDQGRLSLNPLKHLDPFGTVLLPGMLILMNAPVFGYAKPVPYNPRYFKNPRRDDLIVGLAGPAANLALALVGALIAWVFLPLVSSGVISMAVMDYVYQFLAMFVLINLYLMFFNLLPIPPLDGSSIFAFLLPEKYLPGYYKIQRYALPVFLIIVIVLPQIIGFSPIGVYLKATAGTLGNLMFPFRI